MATYPSVHTEVTAERWRLVDDGARFSLDADTLSREPRVFTTFVAIPGSDFAYSIAFLSEHLHRVRTSAAASGRIPVELLPSASVWKQALAGSLDNYRSKQPGLALIRIAIGEGRSELYIEPYSPAWEGPITLVSIPRSRPNAHWKHTAAEVSVSAREMARSAGGDEALLLGAAGHVREGAWSNIFWFNRSGALRTSYRELLPGIVRQAVVRVTECRQVETTFEEFRAEATEVFVTQSTTGVTAVRAIDGAPLPACNVRTAAVREQYELLRAKNLTTFKGEPR